MQTIDRRRFNTGLFLGFGLGGCAQLEPGQPDLVVTAIRWSEDDGATWHTGPIQAGSNVWFECDVLNQGTGPTPDGVIIGVGFLASGAQIAWSDDHSTGLPAGATISLRANGGPDGDKYWNSAQAGSYTIRAHVDDINRIPNELDDGNNTLDVPITVVTVAPPGTAIGQFIGGGNILSNHTAITPYAVPDLVSFHCGRARLAAYPHNGYFRNDAPNADHYDTGILALLNSGIKPVFLFEFEVDYDSADTGVPERNYDDWFDIGSAFAARFRPNSPFLIGQGITDLGVTEWECMNELDRFSGEHADLTYAEYHAMLEGLADGIHSEDPTADVFPAGYLSGNRDNQYTGHGYGSAVADLINDGTLAGIDIHTYNDKTFSPIYNTFSNSNQHDYDSFRAACGITRLDIKLLVTEHSIKADPTATQQNYAGAYPGSGLTHGQVTRNWFLTHFFDANGVVNPNGARVEGPRLPWNLWRQSSENYYFAEQISPRIERQCGLTFSMIMDIIYDMHFTLNDPKGTGVHKMKGNGKSVWVFQNIHSSWSSIYGNTFTISDIPSGTTQVDVYDGNGLIQTVTTPALQIPQHTFSTPTGKSYLFVANA